MRKVPLVWREVIFPMWDNQTSGTLSHWFMPNKVEGGKSSFQCGTKRIQGKARQSSQKAKAKTKAKNS